MRTELDARWNKLAQEVLSGMGDWRVQHPTATLQQIEEELDKRMAQMRAGLLEDLAMASAAADVGGSQPEERARCSICGNRLQERGKHTRTLTTQGEHQVQLRRSYGYCPTCQVGFFPLDEQLGSRPKVAFTPRVEEGMARLGTWMPFRAASRELAFFTGVQVSEASLRQLTEQAGAVQEQRQAEQVNALLEERPASPAGPPLQLMSLYGAYVQVVGGEWKEVKTLALGVVEKPVEEEGKPVVHTKALSYFSRMSESERFQQQALVEIHRRGVETATTVCALSDGADWIPKFVDYHRSNAVRILDFAHTMQYVSEAGQAAFDHLPQDAQRAQLSVEERAKDKQARFEQWLGEQRRELKTGQASKVLDELERLRMLMQEAQVTGAVEMIRR